MIGDYYNMDEVLLTLTEIRDVNKSVLVRTVRGFMDLEKVLQREDGKNPGIFETVLKWCRLFLNIQTSINPKHYKLMQQYETAATTAITYIIGYLQYETKEIANYHYTLLEILDTLLQNLPTNVLKRCDNYETGTIACLWKPMEFAVDYKTQFLALKVFSNLLKNIDEKKWDGEFEAIESNSLLLFKDDLSLVLKEATPRSIFENASRELLNKYNMHVLKNVKVLSFYCNFISIGNQYEVFKHLNCEKFWIDLNYGTQSISFKGRLRRDSSTMYQNVDVTLKVQDIKIETGILLIHFYQSNIDMFPILMENIVQIFLPDEEEKRIKRNKYLIEFLDNLNPDADNIDLSVDSYNSEDVFDRLKMETEDKNNNKTENVAPKIYEYIIDTPPTEELHQAVDTLSKSYHNTVMNVTGITPVSTKRHSISSIIKHPIQKFRSKRKRVGKSYEEDYVPYKISKKGKKKHKHADRNRSKPQSNEAAKLKTAVDNAMYVEDDGVGVNMIVDATQELNVGNECTIGDNNIAAKTVPLQPLNKGETRRNSICLNDDSSTNAKASYKDLEDYSKEINNREVVNIKTTKQNTNTFQTTYNTESLCAPLRCSKNGQGSTPLKSILKKSKPVIETITIDVDTDDSNFSKSTYDDFSEVYPQLRLLESRANSIMAISTPRSMSTSLPETPRSTDMMDISDSSFMIEEQTQSENEVVNRKIEDYIKVQQIINDWPDSDDSNPERIDNDEGHVSSVDVSNGQERKHTLDSLKSSVFDAKSPKTSEDLSELIRNTSRIEKCLNLLRLCLNNASDSNKQKVCEIAESIVRESKRQRDELQEIILSAENLRGQIELQRQICIKRSIQIERFQAEAEQLLNDLSDHSERNELTKELGGIEGDVRMEVWKNDDGGQN